MLATPQSGVVVLSSGSTWNPPSILPLIGDGPFPTGSTTYCVFYNSAGAVLANVSGIVSPGSIDYSIPHAQLDGVPAGAGYEIFLVTPDGLPHKIRYGKVFRHEVQFPNAPGASPATAALAFSDTLQRSALGNLWLPISGTSVIFNNTTPGTVAPDTTGVGAFADSGTPSTLSWLQGATSAIDKICLAWVAVSPVTAGSYTAFTRTCTFTPASGVGSAAQMTSLGAINVNNGTGGWIELFYLMNPPTGGGTIKFTNSGNANVIEGNSMVYSGAAGITPGSLVMSAGSGTSWTETIASAAGKYTAAGFAASQAISSMTNTGSTGAVRDIANTGTVYSTASFAIGDAPGIASMAITANAAAAGGFAGIGVSIDPAPPLAYGVSAQNNLFGPSSSALRYFASLNTDSVEINVNMLNNGSGATGIVLCSDILMSTFLAVEFDEPNNQIHYGIGTSPTTVSNQGSTISNAVSNNDNYTISYTGNTKTLAVYKNNSLSPLGTPWVDTGGVVPHGPGYRYVGFYFNNPANSNGLQVSGWAAQDQV